MSRHGDALLQPLVLTEDEAEAILNGLNRLLADREAMVTKAYEAFVDKLYDKIKDAPR